MCRYEYQKWIWLFLFTVNLSSFSLNAHADSRQLVRDKFEPADGKIYHGAQAEVRPQGLFTLKVDWKGIEAYTDACGKRPKLIMHYLSLDSLALWLLRPTILDITKQTNDYFLQIGLDFYSYNIFHGRNNPIDITCAIANGEHDRKIEELAELLIEIDKPVFLRPGYEFGGNGAGQHASKKCWIKAWKRIFNILAEKGAHKTAFIWNTLDAEDYLDYYPGDEYVDWWGISIFRNYIDQNEFVDRFISDARNHNKPVMIAESTPRYVGTGSAEDAWQKWFKPYFNLIERHPHIKAFCYINASWSGFHDSTFKFDCRIQKDEYIIDLYREELTKHKYIHCE